MHVRQAPPAEVKSWGERAEREARRALALDPDLAEAHQAMAAVYTKKEFAWDQTIDECRRALAINPNLDRPHYYQAGAFAHLGVLERVDPEVRQGLAMDPEGGQSKIDGLGAQWAGTLFSGDYPRAERLIEEWLRRRSMRTYWGHGLTVFYQGQHERGESLLEEAARSPSAPAAARAQAALASVVAARGQRTQAQTLIDKVTRGPVIDHHVANSLGAAYAQLGRRDAALRWLRKTVETGLPCHP
jgi:serine/threonine-protein kinase